jgi:ESF2/ABP1 family protein
VEFEDKADAKLAAAALNGQQIGGKRRSAYHFDLWAIKYLPKFKWDHLTEEIAYEKVGWMLVCWVCVVAQSK